MKNKKANEMKAKKVSFGNTSKKGGLKENHNNTDTVESNKELKQKYEEIVSKLTSDMKDEDNKSEYSDIKADYEAIVNNLISNNEESSSIIEGNVPEDVDSEKDYIIDNNIDFSVSNDSIDISDVPEDEMPSETLPIMDKKDIDVKQTGGVKKSSLLEKNKKGNKYLGYNERLLFMVSGIILSAILAFIFLLNSLKLDTKANIVYKQTSNVDYTVALKPNNYYNTPTLRKGMQYIASLIDTVNVNFSYRFDSNKSKNFKYYYYANADVKIYTSDNKVIYSKTNQLLPRKTITKENVNNFVVNENFKINYDQYNNVIKNFKSSYGISANSSLEIVLYVGVEDEKGNIIKSSEADAMKVIIPLTEQMINISMDYKEVNNSNNAAVYSKVVIGNKALFTFTIIFGVISFGFVVLLLLFLRKTSKKKTLYDVKLGRILRDYDKLIVTSKKGDVEGEKIVEVGTFEELLDARDNLGKPIVFTEIHKGQKALFVVNGDKETYKYILKLADLERENNKRKSK